jgi:hypothetical protein
MYYIKDGDVWRVPRKQPGQPKGKAECVEKAGVAMDTSYIYFLDKGGNIARAKRAVGGQKRKRKKTAKKTVRRRTAAKRTARKPAKRKGGGAKKGKKGKKR